MEGLRFSIIIPVYNAAKTISDCLDAVYKQTYANFEVIIVDDCSKDDSVKIAESFPCSITVNENNLGAARTRNRGAEKAVGDILYFIDADTIPKPDVIEKLSSIFSRDNPPAAVVGAYIPTTPVEDFYSKYQNYYTFFNHEKCKEGKIHWFWTACGAIKKDIFFEMGKFNERYTGASAEDMHMGYDLSIAGHEIILDKSVEVTHLHHHSFKSIIKNDFKKSAAWCQLFLEKNRGNKFKHGFTGPRNLVSMISAHLLFITTLIMFLMIAILTLDFFGMLSLVTFINQDIESINFFVETLKIFNLVLCSLVLLSLTTFMFTNYSFFKFVENQENKFLFRLKTYLFHFIVNLIIPFGVSLGIINFVLCSVGIKKR